MKRRVQAEGKVKLWPASILQDVMHTGKRVIALILHCQIVHHHNHNHNKGTAGLFLRLSGGVVISLTRIQFTDRIFRNLRPPCSCLCPS